MEACPLTPTTLAALHVEENLAAARPLVQAAILFLSFYGSGIRPLSPCWRDENRNRLFYPLSPDIFQAHRSTSRLPHIDLSESFHQRSGTPSDDPRFELLTASRPDKGA